VLGNGRGLEQRVERPQSHHELVTQVRDYLGPEARDQDGQGLDGVHLLAERYRVGRDPKVKLAEHAQHTLAQEFRLANSSKIKRKDEYSTNLVVNAIDYRCDDERKTLELGVTSRYHCVAEDSRISKMPVINTLQALVHPVTPKNYPACIVNPQPQLLRIRIFGK
jgi:hypothetical protein